MVASEQHGNGEQKKTDVTDQKESFRKKLRRRWKYTLMGFLLGGTIASVYAFVGRSHGLPSRTRPVRMALRGVLGIHDVGDGHRRLHPGRKRGTGSRRNLTRNARNAQNARERSAAGGRPRPTFQPSTPQQKLRCFTSWSRTARIPALAQLIACVQAMAIHHTVDLEAAIKAKMEYNRSSPYRDGEEKP